jgi:ABC-type Na+ efflux pump permease subunit
MHPTQWDNKIIDAPVQSAQYAPRSSQALPTTTAREMLLDAAVPNSTVDVQRLQEQIRQLTAKLDKLEKKVGRVESSRSHDIILMVVLVIFLLFIVDNVFGFNKLT